MSTGLVAALAFTLAPAAASPPQVLTSTNRAPEPPAVAEEVPAEVIPLASEDGQEKFAAAETAYQALLANGTSALEEQATVNAAAANAPKPNSTSRAAATVPSAAETDGRVEQGQPGNGNYAATPLSSSATWEGGGPSGSFSWKYPFRVPTPAAGPTPQLEMLYNSGSVDGRTFTSNNQPSVLGEGFELSNTYITRGYGSCHDDGNPDKYDQCWRDEQITLVMNGQGFETVKASEDVFRLKQDDGSTLRRLTGATNGDNNGEHWQLTTADGTDWTFGQNRLPGWTAGAPTTDSTWTVPVVTDDASDPAQAQLCKADNYAPATSWCQQAWRWNVDLVTDTNGNAATFWYEKEENFYARNGNETSPTRYDRGGYLNRVDYGLRRDALFSGTNSTKAPNQARIGYTERCLASECDNLTETTKAKWPDVPFDSLCSASQTCKDDIAPTFFTRKRLTSVTTAVADGTGYRDIDRWTVDHVWVDPGDVGDTTDQILWPTKIQHEGLASNPSVVTRPVKLMPSLDASLGNRVDRTNDGIAPLIRPRLSQIITESGAVTDIRYSATDCSQGSLPSSDAGNTRRCFPVYWAQTGGDPKKDWFHKYVVEAVSETDTTTGESVVTDYKYVGDPAWHYSEDHMTANQYRTWSEWRGYQQVDVLVGQTDAPVRSLTSTVYMRGMHGDRTAGGGTRDVSVTGINAPALTDKDALAGSIRETVVYNGRSRAGTNGAPITSTINTPVVVGSRAAYTYAGGKIDGKDSDSVTVTSQIVRMKTTEEQARVTSTSTPYWRSKVSDVADFDNLGYPLKTDTYTKSNVDTATPANRTCTQQWYARNAAAGLLELVARTQVLATSCASTGAATLPADGSAAGDVISDTAIRYDGATAWSGQTPDRGNATWQGRTSGYATTGAPTFQTAGTTTYDTLGRTITQTDALDNTTRTTFTPSGAGVPRSYAETNAKGHTTTITVDPATGLDTSTVDANGLKTEKTYDALGRLTAVWAANVSRAGGAPATWKFDYYVGGANTTGSYVDNSWIATSTPKGDGAGYNTTYEIFDSLLRPRQTQVPSPSGGRVLTDIQYNDRGLAARSLANVWDDASAPNGVRQVVAEGGFIQNDTTFDGANRPIGETTSWVAPEENGAGLTTRRRTMSTAYTGDGTAVTAFADGMGTRTITDPLGRTSEYRTYPNATPSGSDYLTTTLAYDNTQRLKSTTATDGTAWTYSYDLFGRTTRTTDPDRGRLTTVYDKLDRVRSTTDLEGRTLAYTYDVLSRKTGLFDGAVAATDQLAEWTYDSAPNGIGLPAASKRFTQGKGAGLPAYTKAVTAYDPLSRPISNTLTLPNDDPLVAEAPASSNARVPSTLEFKSTYNRDGTPKTYTEPLVPGLSSEVVSIGYDTTGLGLPTSLKGATGIVQGAAYTQFNEPAQIALGLSPTNPNAVYLNYSYDGLRRLDTFSTTESGTAPSLLALNYGYNEADQVTYVDDVAADDPDRQCFSYGDYQRLQNAWTPAASNCAVPTTPSQLGGSDAPYWHSYTYNENGSRATSTLNPLTSGTPAAVTRYVYGNGTATCTTGGDTNVVKPHALVRTVTGTDTDTYCNNKVGDTVTSSGPDDETRTTTWTSENQLKTITQGTTKYTHIYDADGSLLIKRPAGGAAGVTTLYLGSTEVQVRKTQGTSPTYTATARRYYSLGDTSVALRTGSPGQGTKLYFQTGDHHNTASAQWDATSVDATRTKRYFDPFGGARAENAGWADDKAFLGMPHDQDTGITHIGAREYDPVTGRFLTVDPLMDISDPQTMNGYTYSNNNPLRYADPTGLMPTLDECACGGGSSGGGGSGGGGSGGGGGAPPATPSSTGGTSSGGWTGSGGYPTVPSLPQFGVPYLVPQTPVYNSTSIAGDIKNTLVEISFGLGGSVLSTSDFILSVRPQTAHMNIDTEGALKDKAADWGYYDETNYRIGYWGSTAIPIAGWAGGAIKATRLAAAAAKAGPRTQGLLGKSFNPSSSSLPQIASNAGPRMPPIIRAGGVDLPGVPPGAVGRPVLRGDGLQYDIPPGTPGLERRVTGIRIMDPKPNSRYPYPNHYAAYMNETGQTVNPLTGRTTLPDDPFAHIELP